MSPQWAKVQQAQVNDEDEQAGGRGQERDVSRSDGTAGGQADRRS